MSDQAVIAGPGVRDQVTVRFAGDSGDGMTLVGLHFVAASLAAGDDVRSAPSFPSEIRAQPGSLHGVSAYQVRYAPTPLAGPGDRLDALFAMNPASLRRHVADLEPGGLLVVNEDAFVPAEWVKANYKDNPLTDGTTSAYRVAKAPIERLHREAVAPVKLLAAREAERCRNFFALGLALRLFDRPFEPTLKWIRTKFAKNPVVVDASTRALLAGHHHAGGLGPAIRVAAEKSPRTPGKYRRITGAEALALGFAAAAERSGRPLVFASCPSPTATEVQQRFFALESLGARCASAEDDGAAAGIALGAAFAGAIGVTATAGVGLAHAADLLRAAAGAEVPLVVVDVEPRTGSDLLTARFGRPGEAACLVLAPTSPAEGFSLALGAVDLATRAMTPVVLIADAGVVHGAESWRVPEVDSLALLAPAPPAGAKPHLRDALGGRPWVTPGTPGGEHRLVGFDANEPPASIQARMDKLARVSDVGPPAERFGDEDARLVVVAWGSAVGVLREAIGLRRREGQRIAGVALRMLGPFPANLEAMLVGRRVVTAERADGPLATLLRAAGAADARPVDVERGGPFAIRELADALANLGE